VRIAGIKRVKGGINLNFTIKKLITYALDKKLIEESDKIYVINSILGILHIDEYEEPIQEVNDLDLEAILKEFNDYAVANKLIPEDTVTYRDLFDTKIMGVLVKRPSEVIKEFNDLYKKSPESAANYFYDLSKNSDYIRTYRVKKDMKWVVNTEYGDLDITINLSKPEKNSKDIAAAKAAKQSGYPKCLLCLENQGYFGRLNHPARQTIRVIPLKLNNEEWSMQYSPYVYYNEHCIVFNNEHIPMKVDGDTLVKLFDFVNFLPHYFIGSNAGLPIVGGSILTHEHFQGGNYTFAMTKAPYEFNFKVENFNDVESGILKWPMSVIRLRSASVERVIELGKYIMSKWDGYTDESANIYAETNGERHNAITPIARKNNGIYELDIVLRNNLTTEEYPDGVFHPHKELHHIKKENIGLIEVMGLAVLPPRLKQEMEILKEYMLNDKDISSNEKIEKHAKWAEEIKNKYSDINDNNIDNILKTEIGNTFLQVLKDAGVFKNLEAFKCFINTL